MALVTDAIGTIPGPLISVKFFSKNRINEDVLDEMQIKLDEMDRISITFLMVDEHTDLIQVIKDIDGEYNGFTKLSKLNNWAEKLLEALVITKNIDAIRKLGYDKIWIEAMKQRFLPSVHNHTVNINRVMKSLYFLCNSLVPSEVNRLADRFNKQLNTPIQLDKKNICLELYILYWLKEKHITINKDPNLNNILKCLKDIDCLSKFNDFEIWKRQNENQQDSTRVNENGNSLMFINNNDITLNEINENIPWVQNNKRLCIIINEVYFEDPKEYENRKGSNVDEKNLNKSFKGCGFKIKIYRNLTKDEMLIVLNQFNEPLYKEYSSIFMCILSHGYQGHVVFSDNKSLSIDEIEDKFCCKNLENVFKIVILQSCQGRNIGTVDPALIMKNPGRLVTDGPQQYGNPLTRLHFGLFLATVTTFVSMRHESEGTWFIQDICTELQKSTPISVTAWTRKVIHRVSSRKDKDIVQVPRFQSSIPVEYILPKYDESLLVL